MWVGFHPQVYCFFPQLTTRHAISSCAVDHDTWICSICIPFVNRSYNVQVLSLAADIWCGTRILSIVLIMWFSMEHITCWLVLSSPKNLRQKKHGSSSCWAWTCLNTYVQPPEITTGYKVSYNPSYSPSKRSVLWIRHRALTTASRCRGGQPAWSKPGLL